MPKFKTETETRTRRTPDRTTRGRAAKPASGPELARVEQALHEVADAVFDLAHVSAPPAERPCIRRVRRALLGRTRTAPEFEDVAVTAEALLRALENERGPLDPRIGQILAQEIARAFSQPMAAALRTPRPYPLRRAAPLHPHDVAGVVYRFA